MTDASIHDEPGFAPATMNVVRATRYGGVDALALAEVPVPSHGNGQVLVAVEASSVNALDWHFLTGTPYLLRAVNGVRTPKRSIPGADVAGVVVSVGEGVDGLNPGDAVFGECAGGGCAPFVAVNASSVVPKPDDVSFVAAAATPVAGLTALQGLRTHGDVQPGDHVLINGAAGGVGTFAVQIAKALGAEVTAVCSTRNLDMVRALGADNVVDYTTSDFVDGGRRFDVVFDGVGNRTPEEFRSTLRPGARFVGVSGPKSNRWLGPVPHLLRMALKLWRADASFHQFTAGPNADDLAFLAELLASGAVVPAIDRVVGLDGVADALAEIGSGHARSKIVIEPARVGDSGRSGDDL